MSVTTAVFGLHAVRAVLARRPEQVVRLLLASSREDARIAAIRHLAAGEVARSRPGAELDRLVARPGVSPKSAGALENGLLDLLVAAPEPPRCWSSTASRTHIFCMQPKAANCRGRQRRCDAELTPVVRKSCQTRETMAFAQVTNLARTLRDLKDAGLWIVGTEAGAPQALFDAELGGPLALVMGGEGSGMRRLTRECCDFCVSLPMQGAVESLNVSVAAGILLFEVLRQRHGHRR